MLKLNDIGLSFANKKQVLDDITLTLNQKEIVGLVAPNGTGKTTLLNVIMNNLKPDRGYVVAGESSITASFIGIKE